MNVAVVEDEPVGAKVLPFVRQALDASPPGSDIMSVGIALSGQRIAYCECGETIVVDTDNYPDVVLDFIANHGVVMIPAVHSRQSPIL